MSTNPPEDMDGTQGPDPEHRLGTGAQTGIGTGIGCLSIVLAVPLLFVFAQVVGNFLVAMWVVFLLPVVIGIGLLFSMRTRGYGIGMLIASAAAWLIVLGPCVALLGGG